MRNRPLARQGNGGREARVDTTDGSAGLTLIEILVTITVLGALSAIVILAVTRFHDEGANEACRTDYRTVEVAQQSKYADTDVFAEDVDELLAAGYLAEEPAPDFAITTDDTGTVFANGVANASGCPA